MEMRSCFTASPIRALISVYASDFRAAAAARRFADTRCDARLTQVYTS